MPVQDRSPSTFIIAQQVSRPGSDLAMPNAWGLGGGSNGSSGRIANVSFGNRGPIFCQLLLGQSMSY